MKAIAINGSPRKNRNTATLLENALNGAKSQGSDVEMIHLYDLNYTGCISCFNCKRKDDPKPGQCSKIDELSPVLEKIMKSDILFIGSPIYLGDVTGAVRCLLERLAFMNMSYDNQHTTVFQGNISSAFFFTMNMREEGKGTYLPLFRKNTSLLRFLGGTNKYYASYNTYQFDDYSQYHASMFNEEIKRKIRAEVFPKDCQNAFEMGKSLAQEKFEQA